MLRSIVLMLACACGSHRPDPSVAHEPPTAVNKLPDGPPFATPGERMSYRLALGEMEVASYDIAVGDVTEVAGKQAIVVQSHAKALGIVKIVTNVDDTFTSWIDTTSGRPLLWTVDEFAVRGSDKERTEARLHQRQGDLVPIDFHVNDDAPTAEPQRVSLADVWDYNAFLVALRSWEAPTGSSIVAEVLRSRFLWRVTMTVHGRERVVTDMGEYPALRLDGRTYKLGRDGKRVPDSDERDLSIWISDDADRVPLQTVARTDYGNIRMTLVDYQPGTAQAPQAPKPRPRP